MADPAVYRKAAYGACNMVEDTLVVEAIMREMARAQRWQTVEACWNALLTVRRMHDDISKDCKRAEPTCGSARAAQEKSP